MARPPLTDPEAFRAWVASCQTPEPLEELFLVDNDRLWAQALRFAPPSALLPGRVQWLLLRQQLSHGPSLPVISLCANPQLSEAVLGTIFEWTEREIQDLAKQTGGDSVIGLYERYLPLEVLLLLEQAGYTRPASISRYLKETLTRTRRKESELNDLYGRLLLEMGEPLSQPERRAVHRAVERSPTLLGLLAQHPSMSPQEKLALLTQHPGNSKILDVIFSDPKLLQQPRFRQAFIQRVSKEGYQRFLPLATSEEYLAMLEVASRISGGMAVFVLANRWPEEEEFQPTFRILAGLAPHAALHLLSEDSTRRYAEHLAPEDWAPLLGSPDGEVRLRAQLCWSRLETGDEESWQNDPPAARPRLRRPHR